MKGSSVDRSVFEQKDRDMIANGKASDVMEKYKKKILKDNDFLDLGLKFRLTRRDADMFQKNIANDAEFLKGYELTDYSILLSIHRVNNNDLEKSYKTYRILKSSDDMYLYNFSIIDFLCVKFCI